MYAIQDKVRIKPPFAEAFPSEYTIKEVFIEETYVILEEIESAFDFTYIEKVV